MSRYPLAMLLLAWLPADALMCARLRMLQPSRVVAQASATATWGDLTETAMRLTDAQLARTVLAVCAEGSLCSTLAAPEFGGAIFTSEEAYVTEASGSIVLGLASEQTAGNLEAGSRATFFVRAPRGGAAAGSSLVLVGAIEEVIVDDVSDADLAKLSAATGKTAEEVASRVWRRLVPNRVHLNDAVRNVESWVPAAEYAEAAANPLAPAAAKLLAKINGGHTDSLKRFAAVYSGVEPSKVSGAELLGVDQLGFDLRVTQGVSSSLTRVGFRLPPANEEEGISVFMKLFQEAYEKQHGWM